MNKKEAASIGGKARAIQQKEESVKRYYENPKICKYCGKIIPLIEGVKPSYIRAKKFCNHSCAAKYNNLKIKKHRYCMICEVEIKSKKAKYCDKCRNNRKKLKNKNLGFNNIGSRTKGDVFKNSTSWQIARNAICKNARQTYWNHNKEKVCKICGYIHHIEVCHIKPVSEFSDDALISEINNINNLIGLCPNHHWEFDNSILTI